MPTVFGIEHIVYLIIAVIIFILLIKVVQKYCTYKESRQKLFIISGIILLFFITWNRIALSIQEDHIRYLIPSSFCGVTSFLLALSVIFIKDKNSPIFHVLFYIGFFGGLIVTVYPDFIGQSSSIFYPATISGMIHHTLSLTIVLLLLVTKEFKPKLKNFWYLPLALSVYMTWGLLLIQVFGFTDAMQINEALIPGSIFTWYFVGALLIIVQLLFLFIWEHIVKKNNNQEFIDIT